MAYVRKTYTFKNVIEIEEYHNGRYGAPGMSRQPKKKATKEQIEKQNQLNKEKRVRHKLRCWFNVNDYFSCLTYEKDARPPDMDTAKQQFAKFIRQVKKEYLKRGHELRWLRNIEVGSKNAWHIHIVINRIPDTDIILSKLWEFGHVKNVLLYEKGEFAELAKYITKTPQTDKRLRESNYSASRNLPVPEPKKKVLLRKTWREATPKKGFYIDKDTLHEGINPVTGYPYRHYTMIRVKRRE